MVGLLITLFDKALIFVILIVRFYSGKDIPQPTGLFKIYVSASVLVGMCSLCLGAYDAPRFMSMLVALVLPFWALASAAATWAAPKKWSIFPVFYVLAHTVLAAYVTISYQIFDLAPLLVFGFLTTVGAILTQLMLYKGNRSKITQPQAK